MSRKIIDYQTYIELADDIANGVMEELFCHLLPNLDEEEWDPEGAHKECAETEDAIRMIARGELECYFQISDEEATYAFTPTSLMSALVSEKPAGYTGVTDDENKGVPLSQEEIDTLLTEKTGGMYND